MQTALRNIAQKMLFFCQAVTKENQKKNKKTWFCISLCDHCEAEWYNGSPAERHTGKPRAKIIQDKMGIDGQIAI